MNPFPHLPPKAAYLHLSNPTKRNALSLPILRSLLTQLQTHLTPPNATKPLTLPPFNPTSLSSLRTTHPWLVNPQEWTTQRASLPSIIVLRSPGPVFSSGHDLREVSAMTRTERTELFSTCAELMSLIRRSPAIVVCPVQGLATAAGCQLALSCDITIAKRGTEFQLPGMTIGLPCTSPVTAVSRRVGAGLGYRMFALAEGVRAEDMGGAVDVVGGEEFEQRVDAVVQRLAGMSGQVQAYGKWAFWTQMAVNGGGGGDGYEEAVRWAGDAMVCHAEGGEAGEGMGAFLGKKTPKWMT
ncbi:hypothetical protein OQA88_3431 [Cercophora sp. LCS_1]